MSYKMALSGTSQRNTAEAYNTAVAPGMMEPWLDAALVVQGVSADQAPRLPSVVRNALTSAGAVVDRVEWGSGDIQGRLYVRWQPTGARQAVEYANAMARFFTNYATQAMPGARLILERYRIDRTWPREDVFVYPDDPQAIVPVPPSAPPERLPSSTNMTPVIVIGAAAGGLVLVSLGAWAYSRRTVKRNRRRRR